MLDVFRLIATWLLPYRRLVPYGGLLSPPVPVYKTHRPTGRFSQGLHKNRLYNRPTVQQSRPIVPSIL